MLHGAGGERSALRVTACLLLAVFVVGCGGNEPASGPGAKPGPASGSPASGAKRMIILTNGNSPYWDACRRGVIDANQELDLAAKGLTASLEVNDGTPKGQIDKIRQFGTQADIVAVGVSILDGNNAAIADELQKLKDKGVHVVAIDSDFEPGLQSARLAFIGTNNIAGGRELGVCARNLRPEGGEFVSFVGRTGAQNAIERVKGFNEGAGEKFTQKDNMEDKLDLSKARENVRNAIRNHPKVNTLVGIWSPNAPAIVDVVTELNRRADFAIVGFDAEPIAVEQMGKGLIDAMVVQNPYQMGFQGVRMLAALVKDDKETVKELFPRLGEPGGDIYDTGLKVVIPDDKSPLNKKELFSEKTELLTLEQFQEWLKKYNLSGS